MVSFAELQLPPNFSPKAREAVAELLELVRDGFTGNLSIDLKEGIPLVCKRTETRRFGKPQNGGS